MKASRDRQIRHFGYGAVTVGLLTVGLLVYGAPGEQGGTRQEDGSLSGAVNGPGSAAPGDVGPRVKAGAGAAELASWRAARPCSGRAKGGGKIARLSLESGGTRL